MNLARFAEKTKAQSVLEYALLASLSIMAFLALGSFFSGLNSSFENHFNSAKARIVKGY